MLKPEDLKKQILKAFRELDSSHLSNINPEYLYMGQVQHDWVKDFTTQINKLKQNGLSYLIIEPSKCQFCYSTGTAFVLKNPHSNNIIIRYVIQQKRTNFFIIEECKNSPIPDGEDGLPF